MRLANVDGRAVLVTADNRGIDIATASEGKLGPSLNSIYADWDHFTAWAGTVQGAAEITFSRPQLGAPSPSPDQVIAIGLNYSAHAAESGFEVPTTLPPTFTKFPSCLAGPEVEVTIPTGGNVDWEVELVAIIGRVAFRVAEEDAWDHVAGLTIGQDISDRVTQFSSPPPQFSLGKSFPNFGPMGPWLVTPDAVPDKDDLALGCAVDGTTMQDGRTGNLLYPVPRLIAELSRVITLRPGDVIFTGTPDGVGQSRTPQRFLKPGETLTSWIDGIGDMRQHFIAEQEG